VILQRLLDSAALAALVGGRIYAKSAPAAAPLPLVIWQRAAAAQARALPGGLGLYRGSVQLDAYGRTRQEAAAVAEAAIAAVAVYDEDVAATVASVFDSDDAADPAIYRRIVTLDTMERVDG